MRIIKRSIVILGVASMLCTGPRKAEACTRAVYIGPDNMVVTGRTMDWKEDIMSNIYVFPEGWQEPDIIREKR